MNSFQKQYQTFIESVCTKFGCPEAIRPLQEGFSAMCESEWAEESFHNAHQAEEPELCGEPEPIKLRRDAKPVEYCKGCGQPMYLYGYLDQNGVCPECRGHEPPDYVFEDEV